MLPVSAGLKRRHMLGQSPPASARSLVPCVSRLVFFFCFQNRAGRSPSFVCPAVPPPSPLRPLSSGCSMSHPPQPLVTYQGISTAAYPPFPGARVAHGIPTVNPKLHSLLFSNHYSIQNFRSGLTAGTQPRAIKTVSGGRAPPGI